MNPNLQDQPALPELKRFLDRLLGIPASVSLPPALQQDYLGNAKALGIVPLETQSATEQPLPITELIERTRACIRLKENARPADQALETMSAPPAMPEATS